MLLLVSSTRGSYGDAGFVTGLYALTAGRHAAKATASPDRREAECSQPGMRDRNHDERPGDDDDARRHQGGDDVAASAAVQKVSGGRAVLDR